MLCRSRSMESTIRTGIVHNGHELPRQRGASFQKTEVSIAGIRKSAIDAHPPWQGISGDTFGEWNLSLRMDRRTSRVDSPSDATYVYVGR